MKSYRCPRLDMLGRELIEAYRRSEERDPLTTDWRALAKVETLQHLITQHRQTCPQCQKECERGAIDHAIVTGPGSIWHSPKEEKYKIPP